MKEVPITRAELIWMSKEAVSTDKLEALAREVHTEYVKFRRVLYPAYRGVSSPEKKKLWREVARRVYEQQAEARVWIEAQFLHWYPSYPQPNHLNSEKADIAYQRTVTPPSEQEVAAAELEVISCAARFKSLRRHHTAEELQEILVDTSNGLTGIFRWYAAMAAGYKDIANTIKPLAITPLASRAYRQVYQKYFPEVTTGDALYA